jgi:hypothetical protein
MSEQPQGPAEFGPPEEGLGSEPQPQALAVADPKAVLEQLRAGLAKAEADAQSTGARAKSLKADLATLEKALQEVDKSTEAYGKAHPGLAQQVADFTEYTAAKREVIVAAVGDRKDDVDSAVAWFKQRETDAVADVENSKAKRVEADKAYVEQEATVAKAQIEYAAAKDRVRTVTDGLKAIEGARTDLEAAEDKSEKVLMYAALVEVERLLDAVQLMPTADYRSELTDKWSNLNDAQQSLREADQERANATFKTAQSEQILGALRADRVGQIVEYAYKNPVPPVGNKP